ncbi:unnamed protein product [Lampetra planeri]
MGENHYRAAPKWNLHCGDGATGSACVQIGIPRETRPGGGTRRRLANFTPARLPSASSSSSTPSQKPCDAPRPPIPLARSLALGRPPGALDDDDDDDAAAATPNYPGAPLERGNGNEAVLHGLNFQPLEKQRETEGGSLSLPSGSQPPWGATIGVQHVPHGEAAQRSRL